MVKMEFHQDGVNTIRHPLVHTKLLIDFLVLQVPYSEFLCTPCDVIDKKKK